jgi:hypothetical protein
MRVDYYKFSVYAPDSAYRLNGYQFRTLHEAKEAICNTYTKDTD